MHTCTSDVLLRISPETFIPKTRVAFKIRKQYRISTIASNTDSRVNQVVKGVTYIYIQTYSTTVLLSYI